MAFCDLCTTLDFPALFKASSTRPSLHLPPVIWRDIAMLRESRECEICKLILCAFDLSPASQAFNGTKVVGKFETFAQKGVLPGFGRRLWITGVETERDENAVTLSGFKSEYNYCIQPAVRQKSFEWEELPCLQARVVDQHRVNLSLVQSWLNLCRNCHLDHCAPSPRTSLRQFNFRVIDVHHQRLINAPNDCRYVALSYVWGPASQVMNKRDIRATLISPGGMKSLQLPRTIRDSMDFCKAIGQDFLWVDALCIEQDNPDDVASQIAEMDQVYSCATFTIVAAAGEHCNFGLPGFNTPRKYIQRTSIIAGTEYVTTQKSPSLGAKNSKWNTRGWTYQENLLSKRLLVFTDTQVFFRCNRALWCEDVSGECRNPAFRLSDGEWLNRQVSRSKSALSYTRRRWIVTVKTLLSRQFSFDGDILNAFKGVSKTMEPELGSFRWGLPEDNFERALLWYTSASYPIARRPGFPSWSWAGWMHEENHGQGQQWVYDIDRTSVVTFFCVNECRELVPLRCGDQAIQSRFPAEIRAHFECPSAPDLEFRSLKNLDQLLIFWTSSAMVPLIQIAPNNYIVGGGRNAGGEGSTIYSFALSDEWFDKQLNGMVEFIVVSSSPHGPIFTEKTPAGEMRYDCLIIEWVGRVAYRVQNPDDGIIGFSQEFWNSSQPTRKLIILG